MKPSTEELCVSRSGDSSPEGETTNSYGANHALVQAPPDGPTTEPAARFLLPSWGGLFASADPEAYLAGTYPHCRVK